MLRRCKNRFRTVRTRRVEDVISTYDPASDTLSVDATFISTSYGFMDLYKDEEQDDPYQIEKLLSKLESQAAIVIKKIENAGNFITLPRRDVNTLRKFLFVLTYRNGGRSRQFVEDIFDVATRGEVEAFRQAHGLKDFRAVWMLNIRNILLSQHWEVTSNRDILQSDRSLYNTQMQHMQLGIFRPPKDEQFILTENGFGLYEGCTVPLLTMRGMMLFPDLNPGATTVPHTNTYAIAPNLVIVFRGLHMTREQAELDHGIARHLARPQMFGHTLSESYFADFPRSVAEVTYNPPLDPATMEGYFHDPEPGASIEEILTPPMVDGRPINSRLGDTLKFQIHALTDSQAEKVNSLMLTNNRGIITFKSPSALLTSIEVYERDCNLFSVGGPLEQPRFSKLPYESLKWKLKEVTSNSAGIGESSTSLPTSTSPIGTSSIPTSAPKAPQRISSPVTPPTSASTGSVAPKDESKENLKSSLPGLRGAFLSRPRQTK